MNKILQFEPSEVVKIGNQICIDRSFIELDPYEEGAVHIDFDYMRASPFGTYLMTVPIKISGRRSPSYRDLLKRIKVSKTEVCRIIVFETELPFPVKVTMGRGVRLDDFYKGPALIIHKHG